MKYKKVYRGEFLNIETTRPDNLSIQQLITIDIYDTESGQPSELILCSFDLGNQIISVSNAVTFFAVGTVFSVENAGENSGPYTVLSINDTGSEYEITVNRPIYGFGPGYATFTNLETDPETVVSLDLTDVPLKLAVVDNSEEKFKVIRSKQATIELYSSDYITIDTFADNSGVKWLVDIYSQTETLLKGWLSTSDLRSQFLPDPNVIVLTATDGFGFLNDEPLVDIDGEVPKNEWKIGEYIAWALARTGLLLPINAVMNLREATAPTINQPTGSVSIVLIFSSPDDKLVVLNSDAHYFFIEQTIIISGTVHNNGTFTVRSKNVVGGVTEVFLNEPVADELAVMSAVDLGTDNTEFGHFFQHEYLDAKTFETQVGVCENCYSVIEKILGKSCTIFQHNGEWWVVRIDEMQYMDSYYVYKFNYAGEYESNSTIAYEKRIGVGRQLAWMNDDAEVSLEQAIKQLSLNFRYQYPKELVCNIDFDRGTGPDPAGLPEEVIELEPECWLVAFTPDRTVRPIAEDSPPFGTYSVIRQRYEYGYLKDSYLAFNNAYPSSGAFYTRSTPIPISIKDTIEISFDFSFDIDVGGVTLPLCDILLKGESGIYYQWISTSADPENPPFWAVLDPGDFFFFGRWEYFNDTGDRRDWTRKSSLSQPAPESGELFIYFHSNFTDGDTLDMRISNLSINILPYINGSYKKYTSQQHSVIQSDPNKYKLAIEDDVYISDAPRVAMKGALLKQSGDDFTLTSGFYDASKLPSGPASQADIKPYGELQSFDVWNQYNRVMRKFEGTIDGLESFSLIPDILHRIFLTDVSTGTNNKIFMLLHYDKDTHMCEAEIYLHELHDNTIPKVYTGHSFKYLTENE